MFIALVEASTHSCATGRAEKGGGWYRKAFENLLALIARHYFKNTFPLSSRAADSAYFSFLGYPDFARVSIFQFVRTSDKAVTSGCLES
eukprot:scaffold1823_cov108-Cylindrotheca_fusiformis.AAC.2